MADTTDLFMESITKTLQKFSIPSSRHNATDTPTARPQSRNLLEIMPFADATPSQLYIEMENPRLDIQAAQKAQQQRREEVRQHYRQNKDGARRKNAEMLAALRQCPGDYIRNSPILAEKARKANLKAKRRGYIYSERVGERKTEEGEPISARETVLSTTELLESILVHLPANKILTLQCVSKMFKNCYQGSRMLKQKTFEIVDDARAEATTVFYEDLLGVYAATARGQTVTTVFGNGPPGAVNHMPAGQISLAAANALPGRQSAASLRKSTGCPVISVNPLLFGRPGLRPPHNVHFTLHKLKGIVGIKRATLVCDRHSIPTFDITFHDWRVTDSWKTAHVGSWMNLCMIDDVASIRVILNYNDERVLATDKGEKLVYKVVRTITTISTPRMGEIVRFAQTLYACIIENVSTLPPSSLDMVLDCSKPPEDLIEHQIACHITTTERQNRIN